MQKSFVPWILAVAVVFLGVPYAAAEGTTSPTNEPTPATSPIGPLCFSTLPFSDVLVWFLDFQGQTPNFQYFDTVGRDVSGNRAQNVSVVLDRAASALKVGYTTYAQPGFVPVTAGGTINLATFSGPGQCFAPDLASCGAFTFQRIPCPAGSLRPADGGRAMGQQ